MTKDDIIKGIACYQKQQDELIGVIRAHGNQLTQDEFDEEFAENRKKCFLLRVYLIT